MMSQLTPQQVLLAVLAIFCLLSIIVTAVLAVADKTNRNCRICELTEADLPAAIDWQDPTLCRVCAAFKAALAKDDPKRANWVGMM